MNLGGLPAGCFSAHNIALAKYPYVVAGMTGCVFTESLELAELVAARAVQSGEELSVTICAIEQRTKVRPKSLDVVMEDVTGRVALERADDAPAG